VLPPYFIGISQYQPYQVRCGICAFIL